MTSYGTTRPSSTYSNIENNEKQSLLQENLSQFNQEDMTYAEIAYAYDLTMAQLIYQKFGTNYKTRIIWELIAHTGDGILWFFMVLPILVVLWLLGLTQHVAYGTKYIVFSFYVCNVVDIIAIIIMKIAFKRNRPPHHQTDGRFVGPDQHSFPSGHATRSWCIVGLLVHLAGAHKDIAVAFFHTQAHTIPIIGAIWACVICFSRVALGRHYVSDVVAGAIIGFFLEFPIAHFMISALTYMVHPTGLTNSQ